MPGRLLNLDVTFISSLLTFLCFRYSGLDVLSNFFRWLQEAASIFSHTRYDVVGGDVLVFVSR